MKDAPPLIADVSAALDERTARVIGAEAYLQRLSPSSVLASREVRKLLRAPYPPFSLWKSERVALLLLEEQLGQRDAENKAPFLPRDLEDLPTLERPLRKLEAAEPLGDTDFFEVKHFLFLTRKILCSAQGLGQLPTEDSPVFADLISLLQAIHPGGTETPRFYLADALDEELAAARKELGATRAHFQALRSSKEECILDKVPGRFDLRGYFLPEDPTHPGLAALHRREDQTYELRSSSLQKAGEDLQAWEERVEEVESKVRRRLSETLRAKLPFFKDLLKILVEFDLRLARVHLRAQLRGVWPQPGETLELLKGRNPLLEDRCGRERIQAIDVTLKDQATILLGPNMGGKSALLKTLGLFQWAAQMGLPVPAERFVFPPLERVIYVGSEAEGEDSEQDPGLSSFGREVLRFLSFWNLEGPSFWLLDEPARGTHPEEGAEQVVKILKARRLRGDLLLIATHFPKLATVEDVGRLQIRGLTVDDQTLQRVLSDQDDSRTLLERLQTLMDFGVDSVETGEVPRDAARIARALGFPI